MAASSDAYEPKNMEAEIVRPLCYFPEDIWGDRFASFTRDKQVYKDYPKEIEMLKEEVRGMLMATRSKIENKLNLIDTIERLGISYNFEEGIEEKMQQIFHQNAKFQDCPYRDLFTTAVQFRLLRQHSFNISSCTFGKFMDDDGKFKKSLSSDIKGMLSLYEDAQVRTRGDNILEEALIFTTAHLKLSAKNLSGPLGKQVKHALEQTLHKGMPRLEARHYISFYEEDESKIELLLRLAKLDYNLFQMLHKQELCGLMRWRKVLNISRELHYSRDRLVETTGL